MTKISKRKITTGLLFVFMVMSIIFSTSVFAANEETGEIGVEYRGHVQNQGNMPKPEGTMIAGPEALGTRGESLRVEGFWIKLTGNIPVGANIVYQVHVQNEDWMEPEKNGNFAGTTGESQRVESIKINLENLPGYDVYYRGHVQNIGDIPIVNNEWGWVKNGEPLGTTGSSLRLEELEVKIVKQTDLIYEKAGTFGPETGIEEINNNVTVKSDGVTLQNLHIKGNLTIGDEVGEGTVTLNNITVDGDTFVRGGGKNSIHVNGGEYNKITVQQTSSGQVRIVATNATGLEVVISEDAKGEDIILEGAFENVQVDAPDIKIQTQGDTTIKEMNLTVGATGSQINFDANTSVDNLNLDVKADIKGEGAIENANVNADNVTFEKAPVKQTVAPEVTVKPVVVPPKPLGDGYVVIPVTNMTVNSLNDATMVIKDQKSLPMSVLIKPENATNQRVVWSVQNGTGSATISTSGILTGTGIGMVTVTATNPSSGISATKEIRVITMEKLKVDDIAIPGLPGLSIACAAVTKDVGKINIHNQFSVNELGNVTGDAKTQLEAQSSGIGADPNKGYVSYTVSAPIKGALTRIVASKWESGESVDTEITAEKNLGSADAKGYVDLSEVIAEKTGDDWKTCFLNGKAEKILWYYADGTIVGTYWSVSSIVSGTIQRDPYNTGGNLFSMINGDTVNILSGEIMWCPANTILGNEAGNHLGVRITAPTGYNTEFTDIYIGNKGYHWTELAGKNRYFDWYPLVMKANQSFTATVQWGASSTQVFTVNAGAITLQAAPGINEPLESTATIGAASLFEGDTYKWAEKSDQSIWHNDLGVTGTLYNVSEEEKIAASEFANETHLLVFGITPPKGVTPSEETTIKITGKKGGALEQKNYSGSDFSTMLGNATVVWGVEDGENEIRVLIDWDGDGTFYSVKEYVLNLTDLILNDNAFSNPHLDGDSFYANGIRISISQSNDENYSTLISWKGGSQNLNNVFSAVNTEGIKYSIFGGAKDADVETSYIAMNGGSVDSIYGGGYGTTAENSADVKSAYIDISNGTVTNCVYGGAKLYGVTDSTAVVIGNGVFNTICGGGEATLSDTVSAGTLAGVLDYYNQPQSVATVASGNYTKSANILIMGGNVNYAVYGGGQGYGIVDNAGIEIDGGDIYDVCAGGENGLTKQSVITISDMAKIKRVYGVNNGYLGDISYGLNNNLIAVLNMGNVHETGSETGNGQILGTVTTSGILPTSCYIGGNIMGNLNLNETNGTVVAANQYDDSGTLTVQPGKTWTIGLQVILSIPEGKVLTNLGTITNNGTINGTVTDQSAATFGISGMTSFKFQEAGGAAIIAVTEVKNNNGDNVASNITTLTNNVVVKIEGVIVDGENYTVNDDADTITLTETYLNTLEKGSKSYTVEYMDTTNNVSKQTSGNLIVTVNE